MAIKNASDLLVYKFTTPAQAQVTRIKIKTTAPFEDFTSGQTCILNNVTDNAGVVSDNVSVTLTTNSGQAVCNAIETELEDNYNYTCTTNAQDGTFRFIDCTNGANGAVPLLEVLSGTGTFKEGAVEVSIVTQGQTEVYEPVAHSTSASISVNNDLRDVTTKDSQGVQESLSGLKSYELSTDALIDLNANVDVQSFIDDIKGSGQVRLKYSDRIRNVLNTNLTEVGVDGFANDSNYLTQLNNQSDPFTPDKLLASKITTTTSSGNNLYYTVSSNLIEGKKFTWSLYVKGVTGTTTCELALGNSSIADNCTVSILSGNGSASKISSNKFRVTGLSTSTWTRIGLSCDTAVSLSGASSLAFRLYPAQISSQSSDAIFTSSWQIEFLPSATTYQDPTDISFYSGLFLPTSINLDAGVEDNATYSASFSGSQELYKDGLGSELIEDTGFDQDASVGSPGWFSVTGGCTVSSGTNSGQTEGLGKITYASSTSTLFRDALLVVGDYYSLTYTVASTSSGTMKLVDAWGATDIELPSTASTTYTVQFKAGATTFKIEANNPSTIWLSSISLKKVAPQD